MTGAMTPSVPTADDTALGTAPRDRFHNMPSIALFLSVAGMFAIPGLTVMVLTHFAAARQFQILDEHIGQTAAAASYLLDAEDQRRFTERAQTDDPEYRRIIEPLVRLHESDRHIHYLYTMRERDGGFEFVFDTATQASRVAHGRELEASWVGQPYEGADETDAAMIAAIRHTGLPYLYGEPLQDEYGVFVTACAPLVEPDPGESGVVCVDYNIDAILEQDRYATQLRYWGLGMTFVVSAGFGMMLWRTRRKWVRANAELLRLATTDALTGAANRRAFFAAANAELARVRRGHGPASLLILDIDHFKRINDTHGHGVGDEVLRALVATLDDARRPHDLIGRLGGEEFGILLGGTDLDGARDAAERFRSLIAAMTVPLQGGGTLNLTASLGATAFRPDVSSVDAVVGRADAALYAAKNGGRNRVMVADEAPPGRPSGTPPT